MSTTTTAIRRTRMTLLHAAWLITAALPGCGDDARGAASTVTQTIGPEGGTLRLDGATMTIPAGAVDAPVAITIEATEEAAPDGFVALSPVFHCEPSGTTFKQKVSMAITFAGDPAGARIFWSSAALPEFTDVGGTVSGSVMTAGVAHFSRGFVGRRR